MLVSIVVPSYRTENCSNLVGAIDSLLRQRYADIGAERTYVPATRVSDLAVETTLACREKNCNSAQEDTKLPVTLGEAWEVTRL